MRQRRSPKARSLIVVPLVAASVLLSSCSSWAPSAQPLRLPSHAAIAARAGTLNFCDDLAAVGEVQTLARQRSTGIGTVRDWEINYQSWADQYWAEATYVRAAAVKSPNVTYAPDLDSLAQSEQGVASAAGAIAATLRAQTGANLSAALSAISGPHGASYARSLAEVRVRYRHLPAGVFEACGLHQ